MKQSLQKILPAARNQRDFEKLLSTDSNYIILLETRLSQLGNLVSYARRNNKKVFVHIDLIQGLKSDEFAVEFIIRVIKPDGIISTRGNVITQGKKAGIFSIQRLFLLDSHALDRNIKIIKKNKPDFIEVLPGLIPSMITEIKNLTGIPIIAGGLIRTKEDIKRAIEAGATSVTTSKKELWDEF